MLSLSKFQPFESDNLIRIGASHHGGYLIPSNIHAQLLISLGLGDNWEFELDMVRHGYVNNFIVFDNTVSLLSNLRRFTKRLKYKNFKLKAVIYRLIVLFKYIYFFTLLKNVHIKKKITKKGSKINLLKNNDINVDEIFNFHVSNSKLSIILKVDIEGSEYEIIEQILNHSNQIILLIIEFHFIHENDLLFNNLLELIKSKYSLIHTHFNNYSQLSEDLIPNVVVFTFIKRSIFTEANMLAKIPKLGFDSPTTPLRPDFTIKFNS
jgi:hypothetical protein